MEEFVLQRIKELIKKKSTTVSGFAEVIGVKQVTLNQYVNGDRKLSLSVVCKILESFSDVSAEWLLRGTGRLDNNSNEDYQSLRDSYNRLLGENAILREQNSILRGASSEKSGKISEKSA